MTTTMLPLTEDKPERYARQTRNATVFIAVIVALFVALSVIGGVYVGVQLSKYASSQYVPSSQTCASLGGSDLSC